MDAAAWIFFIRELFFPGGCGLCGATLLEPGEAWRGLCDPCRESLEVPADDTGERCNRCGRPLVSEQGRCLSCRERDDWNCESVSVLYPYTGTYRALAASYKFRKNLGVGNFLARRLAEYCRNHGGLEFSGFALVPVPPRPGKIRAAGWDQVEYLARRLEHEGLPVRRCLKRLPSQTQKKLNRQDRLQNLEGRFVLTGAVPRRALIIDDIMTTGATLEACAAALKHGGAEQVRGLCLFYG
ncbi:MAG: double zinc ribbon domain-containing protein [Treponema sp.]|jgi:ComF family protein|nr:double zinc ribbon domain-containing protein [Treponema sp.]